MADHQLEPTAAGEHAVYAVAGGNHVTVLLGREEADGAFDVTEVLAQPGGGPPPHRHAFAEWFSVVEGELTLCEEREGTVVPTRTLGAGDSVWVAPWVAHGTLNLSDSPTRFRVVGAPGAVSSYFAEAGVRVPDERTRPSTEPPGPAEVAAVAERWGIEFWTGPVERSRR